MPSAELVLLATDTEWRPFMVQPGTRQIVERVHHPSGIIEERLWFQLHDEMSDPIPGQPQARVFRQLPTIQHDDEEEAPVFDETHVKNLDLTNHAFDVANAKDKRERGKTLTTREQALSEESD